MPSAERKKLITAIEKCEALALGSRWRRLFYKPLRYINAIGSRSFLKPFFKEGIDTKATLFFGNEMEIRLPAATDIYLTGCKSHPSEIRLAKWMINNIQTGWTVMDIGAHFGYYTLLLQHLTGSKGKVAAFEPSPLAYGKLRSNTNPFSNIQANNLGVSSVTGKQLLAVRGVLASESNSFFDIAGARTILAATVTLDDWIPENRLVPKFIKADVEGGEWQMIQGASAILFLYHPIIAMEIRTVHFETAYYPAIEWLKANGYKMYSLASDGTLLHCTDAWSYMQSNNIDSDNFLFMPIKTGGN
jgi:FkbM family methyltransferase